MRKILPLIILVYLQATVAKGQVNFSSSNLPIVVINSGGQLVDSSWYDIIVSMGVIDNGPGKRNNLSDPFNNYSGKIEIRVQGSSSVAWPKRSFRITTLDAFNQPFDCMLMGMPPHEDWVFKALYQDKSFLRDDLAFRIFNQMGHYASRSRFFELVIDGDYRGVYELLEKVKRDDYRVNISKLEETDVSGNALTGGYIISLDKFTPGTPGWYSNYKSNATRDSANYYLYHYPKPETMPQVQKDYIKNYFNLFENAVASSDYTNPATGYRKYIDVRSFIDNFIITELARNVDGYRASTFFHKDRDGAGSGKLKAGPIWDFNIGFGNCSYNGGNDPYWWQYQQYPTVNYIPFWWWSLLSDPYFKDELKCRYTTLRENILSEASLIKYIDDMAAYLNESQQRNFQRWPIMGQAVYPNPTPVPTSYAGEIGTLKYWLHERLLWLDKNIPGSCTVSVVEPSPTQDNFLVFPNPFGETLDVEFKITAPAQIRVEMLNVLGQSVAQVTEAYFTEGNHSFRIPTANMPPGTYFLQCSQGENFFHKKLIHIK